MLDMHDPVVADRAGELGVSSVPAVAIDGRLVEGCGDGGPNAEPSRLPAWARRWARAVWPRVSRVLYAARPTRVVPKIPYF